MRRLFWLALGVTVGALVVRKLSAAVERLTPRSVAQGLGTGLAELSRSIRDFTAEVGAAMTERERELRADTGMDGQLGRAEA